MNRTELLRLDKLRELFDLMMTKKGKYTTELNIELSSVLSRSNPEYYEGRRVEITTENDHFNLSLISDMYNGINHPRFMQIDSDRNYSLRNGALLPLYLDDICRIMEKIGCKVK